MGAVVPKWSGREARALREALRESSREFADRLGVNDSAVSAWDRRGDKATLRYETQQLLDTVLASAPEDAVERFTQLLELIQVPMGERSTARTRALLEGLLAEPNGLTAPIDHGARTAAEAFLASSDRCFVLTGRPGSGKTHLTRALATDLTAAADIQLHTVTAWDLATVDLATEILRYASHPIDDDPLLTLEHAAYALARPLVVVIDGVNAPENLEPVARQADAILRQVTGPHLRFWLVIRTPPAVDLTAFPILAASTHTPGPLDGVSHTTNAWDLDTARAVWNTSRAGDDPVFDDLPPRVRDLARLPLYMHLLATAGAQNTPGDLTAYRLVHYCVTQILATKGATAGLTTEHLARLAHDTYPHLTPSSLTATPQTPTAPASASLSRHPATALIHDDQATGPVFAHDLIGEYVAATSIADLITTHGRSAAVNALNELATRALRGARAHGLFEFVISALDARTPELLSALAQAPTITAHTLALMIPLATSGTRFATDEVLRTAAARCTHTDTLDLAQALLGHARLAPALAHNINDWLLGLLRAHGSGIWSAVAGHIENHFDYHATTSLLARLDHDASDEAVFLAHHYLLLAPDPSSDHHPDALVAHPDWKVRAALAHGLLTHPHPDTDLVERILTQLAADGDYKVRAALATALATAPHNLAGEHLPVLLTDSNWHVRARALATIDTRHRTCQDHALADTALAVIITDPTWATPPAHVATAAARFHLLATPAPPEGSAGDHALFGLLRELRTGWITLPGPTRQRLLGHGTSPTAHWLAAREAAALTTHPDSTPSPGAFRQAFRALHGQRHVQVALDLHDLEEALAITEAAQAAGADLIEVGDPLIKTVGVRAIEAVKRAAPNTIVVAEMMSADWGRDQVELAANHGADVVQLIGPATIASVSAAVEAGRRLGVAIVLDIPPAHTTQSWIRAVERAGIDGLTITTNIDQGTRGRGPLNLAETVRAWTRLPVAVSGGVGPTDHTTLTSGHWDILIIGRAITDAVHPTHAAAQLVSLIHRNPWQTKENP